jgi:murein DD-endopeptidase MepM/ murein hydrolase activator NlpD
MKVILTEAQFKKILNEVDEKSYPNLEKFFKLMSNPQSQIMKYLGADAGKDFLQWLTSKNSEITNDEAQGNTKIQDNGEIIDPLNGKGTITSNFGKRIKPTKNASSTHEGVDIGVPSDTPVYAAAAGTVMTAGVLKGYGGTVIIDHGTFKTTYGHLRSWDVYQGIKVEQGTKIGNSGGGPMDPNRGTSTGPHLHFEITNNQDVAVNPLNYIKNLG